MAQENYKIPLKEAYDKPRTRRANVAIRLIFDFLKKHKRLDKTNIIISDEVNKFIWKRSIQKPPRFVEVSLKQEKELLYVFLKDGKQALDFEKKKAENVKTKEKTKKVDDVKISETKESSSIDNSEKKETLKKSDEDIVSKDEPKEKLTEKVIKK